MVENENYKSYTANNGTELRFPKESVIQMTAEQRDCYQNFINVLAQILIKYANQGLNFPNKMVNIVNATRPKICRSRP